jgi:hypothetical protein
MITRLDQEGLAKQLMGHRNDVRFLANYLDDVGHYMMEMGAEETRKHPQCIECGAENRRDHNGAKYCSDKCRQKAYRKRLNPPIADKKRNTVTFPAQLEEKSNVTPEAT